MAERQTAPPMQNMPGTMEGERAKGIVFYDPAGNAILDFTCGAELPTGYGHRRVTAAVREQAERLLQASDALPPFTLLQRYERTLGGLLPNGLTTVRPAASARGALLAALAAARSETGREKVIFLGPPAGSSLPAGAYPVPYPAVADPEGLLGRLDSGLPWAETAALVAEPLVLAPGANDRGSPVGEEELWAALQEFCQARGTWLVADERRSAPGISGRLFAVEHLETAPDILVAGRGLASGIPFGVTAYAGRVEAPSRSLGAPSPLALAAALATLEVIEQSDMGREAAADLWHLLLEMQTRYPYFGAVRGRGLAIGIEIGVPARGPDPYLSARIIEACLERNLLLALDGASGNVVVWRPPLIVTKEQIEEAVATLEDALEEIFED